MNSEVTTSQGSPSPSLKPSHRFYSSRLWMIVVALPVLLGLLVPAYYEWTGADQSRTPAIVPITMFVLLGTALATTIALPWLIRSDVTDVLARSSDKRFTMRAMLLSVTAVAVIMGIFRANPLLALGALFVVGVCVVVVRWAWRDTTLRWPIAAMFGCLYGPFLWVFTYGDLHIPLLEGLASFVGLPPFLAVVYLGALLQTHSEKLACLTHLTTGLQLLVGTWLIRRYPRLFVVFLLWSFVLALIGSFGLNALVRM